MSSEKTITVFQPYIPAYRVSFFEKLRRSLGDNGLQLQLVAGRPRGSQASRSDAVELSWVTPYTPRTLQVRQHSIALSTGRDHWRRSDLVVLPLVATTLEPYAALVSPRRPRVVFWGHIDSYVGPPNRIDRAIESWMVRRADGVLAYTERGARLAVQWGADPENVVALNNTFDTSELELALEEAREATLSRSVDGVPTFAYLGGLDSSKRIDLLAAALDLLHQRGERIRLIVGGSGNEEKLLRPAIDRGQVEMKGYVNTREKAKILNSSIAILCPGRVGLLAVDALVSQRPIITVAWPYHAPEAEYLEEGVSKYSCDASPESYAEAIQDFLRTRPSITSVWSYPRLDSMVSNFKQGVLNALYGER